MKKLSDIKVFDPRSSINRIKIFGKNNIDFTFEDLCKEIYEENAATKDEIEASIEALLNQIKANPSARNMAVIAQLLPFYFDKKIKNNQNKINLATVIQKFNSKSSVGKIQGGGIEDELSAEEKAELIAAFNEGQADIPGTSK